MKTPLRKNKYLFPLLPILLVISFIFWIVVFLRYWIYRLGILKTYKLCAPVISIGGIELGGTGKTPFTIYIAETLLKKGFKPVVLTRGYKRKDKKTKIVAPDDSWELVGDEPLLIKKMVNDALVIVGKRREISSRLIPLGIEKPIFVLDDGAQYLKVKKDLNIFLLSSDDNFLFPMGNLRDGRFRLNEAHFIFFKNNKRKVKSNRALIISSFTLEPVCLVNHIFEPVTIERLKGKKVFGFAGIANPDDFKLLLQNNFELSAFLSFPDHHAYTENDMKKINTLAQKIGSIAIITTEKDIIKLKWEMFSLPIYALRVKVKLQDETEFQRFLSEYLN